jgi:hypothetical protein
MDTYSFPRDIETAFDGYERMQRKHEELLRLEEGVPRGFSFERNRAFEELKNMLNGVKRSSDRRRDRGSKALLAACEDRIAEIITRDMQMARRAKERRETLATRIGALRKGRSALDNYGRVIAGSSPRFISRSG